jgi:SPX domain protein involved in polyphosphate accumulation
LGYGLKTITQSRLFEFSNYPQEYEQTLLLVPINFLYIDIRTNTSKAGVVSSATRKEGEPTKINLHRVSSCFTTNFIWVETPKGIVAICLTKS